MPWLRCAPSGRTRGLWRQVVKRAPALAASPVGDYRIVYDVDDTARTVTVAVVGHRREVYRSLDH
jgi:hypothetical protein